MVVACSAPVPSAPPFVARADFAGGSAGVVREPDFLSLYIGDNAAGFSLATRTADAGGHVTVHLLTHGGETGSEINSFVFGSAPPGAVSVTVGPGEVLGAVTSGTYVVGLRPKDILPDGITWRFQDGAGAVVASGIGIR
jgi:hypothetical protein